MTLLLVLACAGPPGGADSQGPETEAPVCEPTSGEVCVVAGTFASALGEERVPATVAHLYFPHDVTIRADGVAFLSDWNNHRIRQFEVGGTIETVAGCSIDGAGPPGPALEYCFNHPMNVAFAPDGIMVVAAWHNHRVVRTDLVAGTVSDWIGDGTGGSTGDGKQASEATQVSKPSSVVYAPDGTLYISDPAALNIRSVDPGGVLHTIAGAGTAGFAGDGGPATEALFDADLGVGAAPATGIDVFDGRIYVADTANHRVRVVDLTSGIIDTLVGDGTTDVLSGPTDVAVGPAGEVYIADQGHSCVRVFHDGLLEDFAGGCGEPGSADGPRLDARFAQPWGVAVDPDGNVWVSDTYNHVVRVVWK
jgi:DNA-binding beta-propeller fold protein YncE